MDAGMLLLFFADLLKKRHRECSTNYRQQQLTQCTLKMLNGRVDASGYNDDQLAAE
jgi:methionine salvage enolase-phosphatase E1